MRETKRQRDEREREDGKMERKIFFWGQSD